jgi:hypothetical protein
MNATEKMTKIVDTIKSGQTLVFSTYLKHISVSPKTLAKWEASGHKLFKVSGDSVLMASGKNYNCIDGCKITIH